MPQTSHLGTLNCENEKTWEIGKNVSSQCRNRRQRFRHRASWIDSSPSSPITHQKTTPKNSSQGKTEIPPPFSSGFTSLKESEKDTLAMEKG